MCNQKLYNHDSLSMLKSFVTPLGVCNYSWNSIWQWQIRPTRSPDCPPTNSYSDGYGFHFYIFSGFGRVMDYPFFVEYPPDLPNTYIKIKSTPHHLIFLSLSHIFSAASLTPSLLPPSWCHFLTASLPHRLTLSSSVLHSQLSPSLSSPRSCSGETSLSAFAWGRTLRHRVVSY